jgi:hypothetical protein
VEKLRGRIDSRQWWILPCVEDTANVLIEIEETHYSGKANADYEILIGTIFLGCFSVAMARKSHMSPTQAHAIFSKYTTRRLEVEEFENGDILPLVPPEWFETDKPDRLLLTMQKELGY